MCDTTMRLSFFSTCTDPVPFPALKRFPKSEPLLPTQPGQGLGSSSPFLLICEPDEICEWPLDTFTTSCSGAVRRPPNDPPPDGLAEASTVGIGKLTIAGGAEKEAGSIPVAIKGTRTSMATIADSMAKAATMDHPRRLGSCRTRRSGRGCGHSGLNIISINQLVGDVGALAGPKHR